MYQKLLEFINNNIPAVDGIYTLSYLDYVNPDKIFQLYFNNKINIDNKYIFFELLNDYNPKIILEIEKTIKNYYELFNNASFLNTNYENRYAENVQFIKFKKNFNYFLNPSFLKVQHLVDDKDIQVNFELVKSDKFRIETIITLPFSKNLNIVLRYKDYSEEEILNNTNILISKFKHKIREQLNANNELKLSKSEFNSISIKDLINKFSLSQLLKY